MRSRFSTPPVLVFLGLLAGCSGSHEDFKPPDRPDQPVQAWVTVELPGMI